MRTKLIISLAAATLLSACSGQMTGVVRGTGEAVKIDYEQGMDSDTLTAQMGSETFVGKSVMQNNTSTFGTAFGTAFGGGTTASPTSQIFSQTTTGDFVAVLLGNQGSTMRCELKYADSSGMTTSGGVGICIHSDNRVVDVVW